MRRLPSYFLSHGGGPWPYMKQEVGSTFDQLEASLKAIPQQLGVTPKAVLVISGHWEADRFSLSSSPRPSMVYDYHGFPPHTYQIRYPAPGSPELAEQVCSLLQAAGVPARLDEQRGFDHGTFSMLQPIYPQAQVPVVQLSLLHNLDPRMHIEAGRLLRPLRDQGVLIIGSGLSYHNLSRFDRRAAEPSRQFDHWLQAVLTRQPPAERIESLCHWHRAPSARLAHPREDHLLPLMVAVGAAEEEAGHCIYHQTDFFGGITVSSFRFGD